MDRSAPHPPSRQATLNWGFRPGIVAISAFCVAVCLLALAAPGLADDNAMASHGFLRPLGPIAEDQKEHFFLVLLLISVALLPVFVLTPIILVRYRRKGRASYLPNWEFSPRLEVFIWGVPITIVVALATQLWSATQRLDPFTPLPGDPTCIQTVGLDWKWLFLFPDEGIATVGEIAVPVGRPVAMELTTDTVMQSFRISALAGQIYAMPGMRTALHLQASADGETQGENTQYNGDGFSHQRFSVRAMEEDDWRNWVAAVKAENLLLTDEVYARLAQQGDLAATRRALGLDGDGPIYFSVEDPYLFGRIIARYHTGAALDPTGQPGSPDYDPNRAELPAEPFEMHGAGAAGCGMAENAVDG